MLTLLRSGRCFEAFDHHSLALILGMKIFSSYTVLKAHLTSYTFPGDNGEGEPPVPIPNTAVKPLRADGTCRATGWESRSLPGLILKRRLWRFPPKSSLILNVFYLSFSNKGLSVKGYLSD